MRNLQDKLLKISLIISISGIFLLLLLSSILPPKSITANSLTNSTLKLNERVKIEGKIIAEKSYEDFSILTLQDNYGKIQLTCNCKNFLNKTVIVEGKVTEYKNTLQVQAEKIEEK